jgi:hypothetical protein
MRRSPRILLVTVAALVAGLMAPAGPASAATENYGDYSLMFQQSAGQYFAGDQVAGQWAWRPTSATESQISWGDPATWPPAYHEHFVKRGDWVLLDGWDDNGTYYTLRVTSEQIGDRNCNNLTSVPSDGGLQHYVRWTTPSTAYCLKAWGVITEQSSGKTVDFGHTQIWSPPAGCSNPYYGSQTCITQWESWWDNHGAPGTAITRKLDRTAQIARGIGMGFTIAQTYPSNWSSALRYNWTWS